jgi:hypothetical protein
MKVGSAGENRPRFGSGFVYRAVSTPFRFTVYDVALHLYPILIPSKYLGILRIDKITGSRRRNSRIWIGVAWVIDGINRAPVFRGPVWRAGIIDLNVEARRHR